MTDDMKTPRKFLYLKRICFKHTFNCALFWNFIIRRLFDQLKRDFTGNSKRIKIQIVQKKAIILDIFELSRCFQDKDIL